MDSILNTTKRLLGIQENYSHFDDEIILNINSAFMSLNQIGVGPEEGFLISGEDNLWSDFLGDRKDLESVKMLVYLKTKLAFDPPQMGYLIDAITKQIEQIEWRLNIQVETYPAEERKEET